LFKFLEDKNYLSPLQTECACAFFLKFKKQYRCNPEKEKIEEYIEDCLRDELYKFQLETEKQPRTNFNPERSNRERAQRELEEDIMILNRVNRDFWNPDREDREESRKKENKKLKRWIEEKVREESGYYD
jgi:hypothetical protein